MLRSIVRPQLVHCSYHKCLTVYFNRVMNMLFNRLLPWTGGFQHYNSHLQAFYEGFKSFRVASVNNRVLDLDRLGDFRLTRFVRDPRDLVVSGYFYHRRGAEDWVRLNAPQPQDWYFANGTIPEGLREHGGSFADYLQEVPEEEGLLAELEFRGPHFESMTAWPADDPRVLLLRYEDILGSEDAAFQQLFEFYEMSSLERGLGLKLANRYSLGGRGGKDTHVRNPSSGQWRKLFTPRIQSVFDERYGALVKQLGYPLT